MKTKKLKNPLTKEELIAHAENSCSFDVSSLPTIPSPTRSFVEGESVLVGNLKNVVIEKVLFDGKAYVYSCLFTDRDNPEGLVRYQADWWFSIQKADSRPTDVPRLMGKFRIFPVSACDISSLLHHMSSGGLVVDPKYQRGYVWTEDDKDRLLESIFDNLDIGAFLLTRHHGYLHPNDETYREYVSLDGQLVKVQRKEDYTVAIVDGQQRLTTIENFVNNRRAYKGIYFSQLHWRDQIEFLNKSISCRIINEEDTSEKEILRMFLQSNRGVPQTPEHLAKIQAMYDAM